MKSKGQMNDLTEMEKEKLFENIHPSVARLFDDEKAFLAVDIGVCSQNGENRELEEENK